jgi:cytochrome c peroxidase
MLADVDERIGSILTTPGPLPRLVLLDPGDGTVRGTLDNPSPDAVLALVRRELAAPPQPLRPASAAATNHPLSEGAGGEAASLFDGRFTRDQRDMIRDMRLPSDPPPDPTNRVADNPDAVSFGRALFSDTRLAGVGRSCASCHAADLLFTNGKDVASEGVGPGVRNVPSILVASRARILMWDGRVDSLWAQAIMPFEDPTELGSSRLQIAHAVAASYRKEYEAIFGPLPALEDVQRFPQQGGPRPDKLGQTAHADAAWTSMAEVDRTAVSRVMANVGKSIAAFERSLRLQPNALDRYAAGESTALTADEKDGLAAFFVAGCAQCHYGPRLSDDAFHVLRFPTGHGDGTADRGRVDGVPRLIADEFSRAGRFSDAPPAATQPAVRATASPAMLGAFRTPSLRGVPYTMPYGHGGGFGGLTSVIDAHRTGGLPAGSRYAVGETEPWAQGFDPTLTPRIIRFLQVLRADVSPTR